MGEKSAGAAFYVSDGRIRRILADEKDRRHIALKWQPEDDMAIADRKDALIDMLIKKLRMFL